ncbi:MAG: CarD family transcriptional regulator [candidate division NC10 bacterium]|nr:CarD family transcriptional regulator [candidate division NC10 bacterium]
MPLLFSIGKKVVYPTHGVARVEAIEEKVVSGEQRQAFYILRILGNGMRVMVPTQKAQQVRLREVIRRTEVPKVMAILRRNDLDICPNWNRRYKDNQERIKSGSLYEVALVLRKLVLLQKDRNLSFGEKKMLETVRQLLVSEISHAAGIDEGEAGRMVDRTITTA